MSEIEIRTFADADRPAVIALVRELQVAESAFYDRMKPPEEIGDWYVDYLLEACARDAGMILVACDGAEVVGYVVVLTAVSSADEVDEIDYSYAQIKDLAVTGRLRGEGIGARLIARAEQISRQAGARWLRISVLSDNEAAIGLYRKSGFRPLVSYLEKKLGDESLS